MKNKKYDIIFFKIVKKPEPKMRNKYDSDISREQFEQISPLLESFRKTTKPRIVDLYDIFCAILYLIKSGCQWRMIPKDFPKWRTVYEYFKLWKKRTDDDDSLLETILNQLVKEERVADGEKN